MYYSFDNKFVLTNINTAIVNVSDIYKNIFGFKIIYLSTYIYLNT